MKSSYTKSPRTMDEATWISGGNAIQHFPQSRTESAAGFVLAIVIGIIGAAAAVHWWSV
jgi:hypothetical protein